MLAHRLTTSTTAMAGASLRLPVSIEQLQLSLYLRVSLAQDELWDAAGAISLLRRLDYAY